MTGENLMISQPAVVTARPIETSPLTLSDHLISLAEEADRAGFTSTARRLVNRACTVFDEAVSLRHWCADRLSYQLLSGFTPRQPCRTIG
jgi:hypothetical protein